VVMEKIDRKTVLIIAAVAVFAVTLVSLAYFFRERDWTFQGISTRSKPADSVLYKGNECSACKTSGPTEVVDESEVSVLKGIEFPNGWRADITWYPGAGNPHEVFPMGDPRWHLRGAIFVGPSLDDKAYQDLINQLLKENGQYSGRVEEARSEGIEEILYWGRVSPNESKFGGDWHFHCSTNCLLVTRVRSRDGISSVVAKIAEGMKRGVEMSPWI